ncbi:MAG: hypothetical protein PHU85_04360 [Phycisphaerae bacterium]|nr:hypothetical protein [Phycisphaerae bacterium]
MASTAVNTSGRFAPVDRRPGMSPIEPALSPPDPADAAQLEVLDEELVRQAEEAIKTGLDDGFDLEGEFLSQEEIARVMAEEAAAAAKAAEPVAPANPPDSPPAAPIDESAVDQPTTAAAPATAAPVEQSPAQAEVAAPAPEPAPATAPAVATEPPPAPAKVDAVVMSADDALGETLAPPAKPTAIAAPPPEPELPLPELSEPAAEPGGDPLAAFAGWKRLTLRVATIVNRPVARLSPRLKNVLGAVGGLLFLAGVALWVIGSR